MRRAAMLLLGVGCCAGAGRDPVEILRRLRDKVLAEAVRVPKYSCVQTTAREYFIPNIGRPPSNCDDLAARKAQGKYSLTHAMSDRLRLDVTVAEHREIFSWAGEVAFRDEELNELIGTGPIGTGSFGLYLMSIFGGQGVGFSYVGDRKEGARNLIVYDFNVPADVSKYRVKAGDGWVFTAYSGTIVADADTLQLVRLSILTSELPPETGSCESLTTLDFGPVQIGGGHYLLPVESRQRWIARGASEAENSTVFSACREYKGESTLRFEAPVENSKPAPAAIPKQDLPAGLGVTLELMENVDSATAAAGDVVVWRVVAPVLGPAQKVLIKEDTRVATRLVRVQRYHIGQIQTTFVFRLESFPGRYVRVKPAAARKSGGLRRRGTDIGELPLDNERGLGVVELKRDNATLERGYRMEWVTGS